MLCCFYQSVSEVPYTCAKPTISVSTPASAKKENGIQPVFVITVDDPQRVGDPIRAYTMYTVHTKVRSYDRMMHPFGTSKYKHLKPDYIAHLQEVHFLRPTALFGLPLAVRNSLDE